jgi:hypothetical protein
VAEETSGESRRVEFDYAWGWFQYHAAQRLTAFNFFLIISGLLLVAYGQAIDHRWNAFGLGLGLLGALVAAGFFALDVRNEELVNRGKRALSALEADMGVELSGHTGERKHLEDAFGGGRFGRRLYAWTGGAGRKWLFTHRFWLRCVIGSVGLGFAAGAIWAIAGYPTA